MSAVAEACLVFITVLALPVLYHLSALLWEIRDLRKDLAKQNHPAFGGKQ